jgi:hypothetical protein
MPPRGRIGSPSLESLWRYVGTENRTAVDWSNWLCLTGPACGLRQMGYWAENLFGMKSSPCTTIRAKN